jgi:hypothetical protein
VTTAVPFTRGRRITLFALSILLAVGAVPALAFPVAQLFWSGGMALWPDTRAAWGAGTEAGAPRVTSVSCISQRYGTQGRTAAGGSTRHECRLSLAWPEGVSGQPRSLSRELPTDRSGQIPRLRLLSAPGEAAALGVVWDGAELRGRWLAWALESLIFWGFGAACAIVAWLGFRRAARG